MTESLRERCIEAGAKKLLPHVLWADPDEPKCDYVPWEEASDAQRDYARDTFAALFDAVLDVLEESDQELIQATYPLNHGETFRKKLWDVLRGNGE